MNKKRKYVPAEWSWTSKLYNATSLAKTATEQSEQVEMLTEQLACAKRVNKSTMEKCRFLESTVDELTERSRGYYDAVCESTKLSEALKNDLKSLEVRVEADHASFTARNTALTSEKVEQSAQISSLELELHRVKRECDENRALKNTWQKKYEELAQMGATALAKITKESYGVSPATFEAYKKIASTQFEVDKAQQERSDALKLLHAPLLKDMD